MPHVVFRTDQNVVLDEKKVCCDFRKGNKTKSFQEIKSIESHNTFEKTLKFPKNDRTEKET